VRALAALATGRERLHPRARVSVPVARLAGTGRGAADHAAPLVDPATPELARPVSQWLEHAAGRRSLVFAAANRGLVAAPPDAHLVERVECPRLDLPTAASQSGHVGRSRNFRVQLGRFERRLAAAGVTCTWREPGALGPGAVDALFELHHANRDERGRTSSLDGDLRALLHACARRDGIAGVVAAKGDEVVGVLLGFPWRDWFGAYQSGWDTTYAHDSIGSVLLACAIRGAAAHGTRTFDFLRGGEAYKYRFGAERAYDDVAIVPRGVSGRALLLRPKISRTARRPRRT
jgi:CelD/BcsL family acetyltransferase involved in cellulose biosynthesis